HGGGRGDVEDLLELLHELGELDEGHLLESFDELVVAELRHGGVPSCWWDLRPCGVERRTRARSCGPVTRGRGVRGTALRLKGGSREPEAQAASCFSRSASMVRAAFDSGAANVAAALDIDAFMAPAALASRTSRDSRSASFWTSSFESSLPSK